MKRTPKQIMERVEQQLSLEGGEALQVWIGYNDSGRSKLVAEMMAKYDTDTEKGCCDAVAEIVEGCQPESQECETKACGMEAVDKMDGHAFCTTCLEAYAHGVMHQREKDLEEIDQLRGRLPMPREYRAAPKMLGVLEALCDDAHNNGIGTRSHAYAMIVDALKEAKG